MNNIVIPSKTEFLDNIIQSCSCCKLSSIDVNKEFGKVTGFGTGNKAIMIGINPGRNRHSFGGHGIYPDFSFKETQDGLIAKCFNDVGLDWNDFYVTNLVKCSTDNNDVPDKEIVECCMNQFLYQEYCFVGSPKIIVCLGNFVYDVISKDPIFEKYTDIYKVYHHSFMMRNSSKSEAYSKWIEQFKEVKKAIDEITYF